MSVPLAVALRNVDLQPGRIYRCEVDDCTVEVRVSAAPRPESPGAAEGMLDPWCELPGPRPASVRRSRRVAPWAPDAPVIPDDEVAS